MPSKNCFEILTGLTCEDYQDGKKKNETGERRVEMALLEWKDSLEKLQSDSDGEKKRLAQEGLALYPTVEAIMKDPKKRGDEAKAMKKLLIEKLRRLIDSMKSASSVQTLTMADVRRIADMHRLKMPTVKQEFISKGFKVQEAVQVNLDEFLMPAKECAEIESKLAMVRSWKDNPTYPDAPKVQTLYDLIAMLDGAPVAQWKNICSEPSSVLCRRCDNYGVQFSTISDPVYIAIQDLMSKGTTKIFSSDQNRKKYDNAMRAEEVSKQLGLDMVAGFTEGMRRDVKTAEGYITKIMASLFPDRDQAIAFYSDRVGLNPPYEPAKAVYTVVCVECGAITELPSYEEAVRINKCMNGHKLFERCPNPNCHSNMLRSQNTCPGCGLFIPGLSSFEGHYTMAVDALRRKDISQARSAYTMARSVKSWDPRLKKLNDDIAILESTIEKPLAAVRSLIASGRYYEARRKLESIKVANPGMQFTEEDRQIREVIDWAEKQIQSARRLSDPEAGVDAILAVLQKVKDYPNPSLPPPPRVGALKALAVARDTQWKLNWTFASSGATFTVVRKVGNKPQDIDDGTVLAKGLVTTSYLDETAEPGKEYGYAVFAERAGAVSPAASVLMSMLRPEVDARVTVNIEAGACQLSWTPPRNCVGVMVLRGEGNKVGKVPLPGQHWLVTRGNSFSDTTVVSGQSYTYRLMTVWVNGDGERQYSAEGVVSDTVRFIPKPDPVNIAVRIAEDRSIVVQWLSTPVSHDMILVRLAPGTQLTPGRAYSNIAQWSETLACVDSSRGYGSFQGRENQNYQLAALIRYGSQYIACNTVNVNTAAPCKNLSAKMQGKYLEWSLEAPSGATGIYWHVSTRSMKPYARSNSHVSIHEMTKDQPSVYAGGKKRSTMVGSGIVTLSVAVEYRDPALGCFYSPVVSCEVRNLPKTAITYQIDWKRRKGGFFGAVTPLIHISTADKSSLPEMKLLTRSNGKMLFGPEDGDIELAHISAGTQSPAAVEISSDMYKRLVKGCYVRLFNVHDEERFEDPIPRETDNIIKP